MTLAKARGRPGRGWPFPPCRLQMTEAALALSEQKAQDLGELLATTEQEQRSLAQRQAKEHRLEQQVGGCGVGRPGVHGGRWALMPFCCVTPMKLQSGSLSSSETCLLPMKRTYFCETRYGGGIGGRASPWGAWGGALGKQNEASSLLADIAGG